MASHSSAPSASIVVPTRGRPDYLEVALASISPQAKLAGAELIVVDDAGPSASGHALAKRFGARYEPHPRPLGLNVARNTGVERSSGEVVVFVDDDVEVSEGWLAALLGAASAHPAVEVFTGPIRPRLEGSPPLSCGREGPPITSLDLGPRDTPTRFAWGANMAIRRAALDRVGHFEVSLEYGGDEQEWQERLRAERPGNGDAHASTVLYVAGAALAHRRNAADARLRPLCRAAFARGKAARRFDAWRGEAPPLARELATLTGCLGHVVRRRCPAGLTMVAHSGGRLRETLQKAGLARARGASAFAHPNSPDTAHLFHGADPSDDFLSGESGTVGGLDGLRRASLDLAGDALEVVSGRRRRLERAAQRVPPTRRVLVLGV